jgi:peptidyl-prolyl cis-trans isomerase SurA
VSPQAPWSDGGGGEQSGDELALEKFWGDDEVLIDGIAAQVGSQIVLLSQVRSLAAPVEKRMREAGMSHAEILAMRAEALERLIEAKLVEEMVRRTELSATDAEITEAIAGIAADNGLSVTQLAESVRSHGLTLEQYRAKLKSEIERSKIINSFVRARIHIEPDELKAIYAERYADQPAGGTEIHLRHLLVTYGTEVMRDVRTACTMVETARSRILSGEASFADMVVQMSDVNRESGGDIGWVLTHELAPWMKPAVRGLPPGSISETIPTEFGCNLLQVVAHRQFRPVTFAEAAPALEEELFRQKMQQEYVAWIEGLRDQVYVERRGIYAEASRLRDKATAERQPTP